MRFAILLFLTLGLCLPLWLYGVVGAPVTGGPATGAQGNRAPEPGGAVGGHILLLGTSLTARGDWPEAVQAELALCAPGVRVERLARAGGASGWAEGALEERLRTDTPGVVVIELSINDASLWQGVPLVLSRARHLRMIAAARQAGAVVFLALLNPAFGANGWERPGEARYRALYRDLAEETGVGLIDTDPFWRSLGEETQAEMIPDGLHPTGAAMRAGVVPVLVEVLRPVICRG
ncbi:GDSL-type esterase/lipase family protein [Frigidibacter sp. SD6-1]|uniref:SGNH/GDSL hydrolase family protein n=1 Tax=Frigidibacter sp. SD6-1 TaxID=3032581 RepID=UPI0024DF8ADE|nr:GDSL-type esterase/lipase family protein [Frigidibacter sp. SD6-1]